MQISSSIFRLSLLLVSGSIFSSTLLALPRSNVPLIDPTQLQYSYSTVDDRVRLSWKPSRGALRYKVTVLNSSGDVVKATRTRASEVKIRRKLFIELSPYSFSVQASSTPTRAASKTKRKMFTFTTRVKTAELYAKSSLKNSGGRTGVYYLPKDYRLKMLPIMVLLHGSSIDGDRAAKGFRKLAGAKNFIIIAPDSVSTDGWSYEVDDGLPTEDQTHIQDCINEVLSLPHLTVDSSHLLIAGVSAGGEVAGFIGSHDRFFTKMADLHGGIQLSYLGDNRIPVWISTGTDDTLRPPSELQSYAAQLPSKGFTNVTYREYPVAHDTPEAEKFELIAWWLGR